MKKYKVAIDITATCKARNGRCARQSLEFHMSRLTSHMDVTYQHIRINGKKPKALGDDE